MYHWLTPVASGLPPLSGLLMSCVNSPPPSRKTTGTHPLERKDPHSGWLMPPSLRTRQKWMAINPAATSGMATQCRM